MWMNSGSLTPVEHAHEHVGAELFLDFDDLELQALVIPGVDVRVQLVEEMAAVADEQRDGDAIGDFPSNHG